MAARLFWVVLVLGGCAASSVPDPAARSSAIINGENEDGYDSTLYLYNLGGVACTGTLISDRVVLTAKHCVLDMPEDGWFAAAGPQGEIATYEVESVATTDGRELEGVDIALLTLRDAPGLAPVPLARDFDAYAPGDVLTLVGYGQTEDGSAGRKKQTVGQINTIGPDANYGVWDNEFLIYGNSTGAGHGDSGGPVFDAAGVQVGVMVRANLWDVTICTRIDRFLDLIDATVAAAGGGGGVVDPPDPSGLGGSCAVNGDCDTGLCEGNVCTSSCDLVRGEGCPGGWYCDARGSCGLGVCVRGDSGSGRVGATCGADLECATRLCADTGDGSGGHCATPCDPESADVCGAGTACVATVDGCGACLASAGEGGGNGGGGFGTGCSDAADCTSGFCHDPGPSGVCTAPCGVDGFCPGGFECDGDMCAPAGGTLGDECTSRADCATGMCGRAGDDETGICTKSCSEDVQCGAGYRCASTNQGSGACWPTSSNASSVEQARVGLASGCSLAGPPEPRPFTIVAMLVALVLVLALRRRV